MRPVVIAHIYPRDMSIYGDLGNVITLFQRLSWRGFTAEVRCVDVGESIRWDDVDIVFGGGGQDSGQLVVGPDLMRHREPLLQLAAQHVPMLVVCGMFQLFGHGFSTAAGDDIPGIGVLGATTSAGPTRIVGNAVVDTERFGTLVGFENHSGQTTLDIGQAALGVLRAGHGNDLVSRTEGALREQVVGTYLHGPVLPRNPRLADGLILAALRRRRGLDSLEPLDDRLEILAAQRAKGLGRRVHWR